MLSSVCITLLLNPIEEITAKYNCNGPNYRKKEDIDSVRESKCVSDSLISI